MSIIKNKFDYIQEFRGIAILLVILTHTTHHGYSNDIGINFFDKIIWYGHQGVTLFFVISAFTIFYSIDIKFKTENNNYLKFILRRFFRIAPLYYLGILFYYIFLGHHNVDYKLFLNLLFLHWLNPATLNDVVPGGWSITTEFTFYFFAPFLFSFLKSINKTLTFFLASVLLSRVCVSILVKIYPNADTLYYILNPLSHFPVFIVGIILYFIIIKKETIRISTLDCTLISMIILSDYILGDGTVLRVHFLAALLFAMLVYITYKHPLPTILSKPLCFIGEISFTLYISHFILLYFILKDHHFLIVTNNNFLNWSFRFFSVLIGSIVLSYPIYRIIELPMIGIGKKLTSQKK